MRRKKIYRPKVTPKVSRSGVSYYLDFKEDGRRRTTRVRQEACRCKRRLGSFEPMHCMHWRTAQNELDDWKKRSSGSERPSPKTSEFDNAASWWDSAVCAHKSGATRRSYLSTVRLIREFGLKDLKDANKDWLFAFRQWLCRSRKIVKEVKIDGKTKKVTGVKQRSPGGVNVHLRNTSAFLHDCVEDGRISPFSSPKGLMFAATFRHATLTVPEIERCLAAKLQDGNYAVRLFTLYYYSGMRLGELLNLKWTFVTDDRFLIRNRADWKPKWDIERDIPIHPSLRPILQGLRKRSEKLGSEYVYCSDSGKRLDKDNVRRAIKNLFERVAAVGTHPNENIGPHTIRHTFATRLVNDLGTPLPLAQKLLGHTNLKTTQRYLHASFEGTAAALAGL